MKNKHNIALPSGICASLNDAELEVMTGVALGLEPLWENALGSGWEERITPKKIKAIYQKI